MRMRWLHQAMCSQHHDYRARGRGVTFGASVAHIMRTDLRELRVPIAIYLITVLVVSATTSTTLGLPFISTVRGLVIVLAAVLVTITFIQADAPTREDTFWATTPTSERAMFWAEIGGLVIVVVPAAVVAQCAVLALHGMSLSGTLRSVVTAVAWLVSLLAVVAVIAAATPNVKASVVGVLLYITAIFLLQNAVPQIGSLYARTPATGGWQLIHHFATAAIGASLYLMYTRHRSVNRARLLALASVAGVIVVPQHC